MPDTDTVCPVSVAVVELVEIVPSDLVANNVPIPLGTSITISARLVTSYVPFYVFVSLPLANSLADTVTAVPLFVPPEIYPAVLVTDGVTVTE